MMAIFFRIVSDLKFPNPIFRIQIGKQTLISNLLSKVFSRPFQIRWTDFLQMGGNYLETSDFEKALQLKQKFSELNNYPQISLNTSFREIKLRENWSVVSPILK